MSRGSCLKSWDKLKIGPAKTCPCSRHAAMIANDLRSRRKDGFGMVLREAGYEVDHMAESIEAAIVSLWQARQHLDWVDGKWVPSERHRSLALLRHEAGERGGALAEMADWLEKGNG